MRVWHTTPVTRRERMPLLVELVAIVEADARRVF
jgi:hypothetical protein